MVLQWIINLLGREDYYFAVPKRSEHNTTGKVELHTVNSEDWVARGLIVSVLYVLEVI